MKELTEKICKIQSTLVAKKTEYNSFGKFNYRTTESILEALKPLLKEQGLIQTISDDIVNVGEYNYIKSTVSVSDGNNAIEVTASAREPQNKKGMDDSQMTGATTSYARKYALGGMWLIDDSKDADFKPEWWDEAVAYLVAGGTIDKIEKKYPLTEELKQRLMDASVSKVDG